MDSILVHKYGQSPGAQIWTVSWCTNMVIHLVHKYGQSLGAQIWTVPGAQIWTVLGAQRWTVSWCINMDSLQVHTVKLSTWKVYERHASPFAIGLHDMCIQCSPVVIRQLTLVRAHVVHNLCRRPIGTASLQHLLHSRLSSHTDTLEEAVT